MAEVLRVPLLVVRDERLVLIDTFLYHFVIVLGALDEVNEAVKDVEESIRKLVRNVRFACNFEVRKKYCLFVCL